MCTLFYATMRRFFRLFDASVHTERTRVATITRLKSGSWRVQVRRKGKYVNETFLRRKDAEEWGIDIERRTDRQEPTTTRQSRDVHLFGDLVALHRQDLEEVGKDIAPRPPASSSWTKDLGIFVFQSFFLPTSRRHHLSAHAAPVKMTGLQFKEMFMWLSSSLSTVSASQPGAGRLMIAPPTVTSNCGVNTTHLLAE